MMNKIQHFMIAGCIAVFASSCGSNQQGAKGQTNDTIAKAETQEEPIVAPVVSVDPDKLPGKDLIAKSDCLACHNVDKKVVGPAYINIAGKYAGDEANIDLLADKIIAGGSGVWGQVPMTPHPDLSKADAKEMVKYIYALKK